MNKAILCAFTALLAATLACSIFVGGPAIPVPATSVSGEPTQTLQEQLSQAMAQAATSGVVTLHITEGQLTSYLAQQLAKQSKPLLSDPVVRLADGQMQVFGKASSGIFTANVSITMQASVDSNGQPQLTVVQTDFGPLAAPQGLNEAVTGLMQEAFTGTLGPIATGFRLESISIADGVMTVTGRIK